MGCGEHQRFNGARRRPRAGCAALTFPWTNKCYLLVFFVGLGKHQRFGRMPPPTRVLCHSRGRQQNGMIVAEEICVCVFFCIGGMWHYLNVFGLRRRRPGACFVAPYREQMQRELLLVWVEFVGNQCTF